MSNKSFHAVVIGAGVMGTAAALELGRRGRRVLLIDQFSPGHKRGSSHGHTRIFRLSYRDPDYVALAAEALRDWQRLIRDARIPLIRFTGGVDFGAGALECAAALEKTGIEFELVSPGQVKDRFGLVVKGEDEAVFQPTAGVIAAGLAVEAQAMLAERAGVSIEHGTRVTSVEQSDEGGVTVFTDNGKVETDVAVLAAGPWIHSLAASAGIEVPVVITGEQVAYAELPNPFDTVVIDWDSPARYAVPVFAGAPGVRVGLHGSGKVVDPEDGPFDPDPALSEEAIGWLAGLTSSSVKLLEAETCLYTNAPNEDFLFQRHGDVILISPCSGHGFKFAPRIGRIAADLVDRVNPALPGRLGEFWRQGTAPSA